MSEPDLTLPMASPPISSSTDARPQETLLQRGAFDPPVTPGTLGRLERFEILRLLGEGGMGQVYLAREPRTDTRVAVKILRPQMAADPQSVHRFLTEARHMYRLSHPRILRVLEVSDRKEGPYYVMPYIEGGSLRAQYQPGQPMPTERAVTVARQIAEALAHAHAHGLIHRDLKPDNVLLDNDGNAYLTDFGLVRTVFNDSMVDASESHIEGTAPYMSPAVARGEAEDTRCDIYAFGALLYELLAGQPPYTGRTSHIILDQVLKGPPTPIRTLNAKASPALVRIAEGCLARELHARYTTMTDVVSDLALAAKGAMPLGPHQQEQRRRLPRIAAVLVGTLAVGLLGMIALLGRDGTHPWKKLVSWQGAPRDLYMVVDLSRGTAADRFPVSYLAGVPKGGWTAEYKTEKLVLRRIEPSSFVMGSPVNELGRGGDETLHKVTLTDAFYIGVFEVTQRQWELVKGNRPSKFFIDYAARPVERVGYDDIRGASKGASWPQNSAVDSGSFIGVLREKTGYPTFDLPTEAQWEYACRAGTVEALSSRKNLIGVDACANLAELGRHKGNTQFGYNEDNVAASEGGTAIVGSFPANPWGLYDMHGNILEWCLDWRDPYPGDVIDPLGAPRGSGRVERGVAWRGPAKYGRSANRQSHSPSSRDDFQGFRVAMTLFGAKDRCKNAGGSSGLLREPGIPFEFSTNNGAVAIFRYTGPGGAVVIPDAIKGLPLTSIESQAFNNCTNMTSVLIPDSVTRIGNNAFGYCNGLTNINLSANVVSLGANPFNCCSALRAITVDAANPAYSSSEDGVLFNKEKTEILSCPGGKKGEHVIPDSVTLIKPGTFYGCKYLTTVTIPNRVTAISLWAFKQCTGLTHLTIPSCVTAIGNNAFYGCTNLTAVYFNGNAPSSDSEPSLFTGADQVTVYYLPGTIGWGPTFGGRPTAEWNGETMEADDPLPAEASAIPPTAKVQGPFAYTVTNGTAMIVKYTGPGGEVAIPAKIDGVSVTAIGESAFHGCAALTGVTIPDTVTALVHRAFQDCTGLTNLTIPGSVMDTGARSFMRCTGLTNVTMLNGVATIGFASFAGCTRLTHVTLPNTVTRFAQGAFRGSDLHSITIPASVTTMDPFALSDCPNLTEIAIPANVISIRDSFVGRSALLSIMVDPANPAYSSSPDGALLNKDGTCLVSYPGGRAGNYDIPTGISTVGYHAFNGCTYLTSVTLPESVASIEQEAFRGCENLTVISFKGNAPKLGKDVFEGGNKKATVYNRPGTKGWGKAFGGLPTAVWNPEEPFTYTVTNGGVTITKYTGPGGAAVIPRLIKGLSVTVIGDRAFHDCASLTGVTIPDSVTRIGGEAFRDCASLTAIAIPDSVTHIAWGAFWGCSGLTDVTLSGSLTRLDNWSFSDCTALAGITIPSSVGTLGREVFRRCENLTAVTFKGDMPSGSSDLSLFAGADKAIVYYLPGTKGWGKEFGGRPTAEWDGSVQTTADKGGLYMVVDLSEGTNATRYPVTYLDAVPAGGWTGEYKTEKLVLRRIGPGTFVMGSPTNEVGRRNEETPHEVTLNEPFYMGVFEVTQKQWERVMGNWPSYFSNVSCREERPVEQVSYMDIRRRASGANWPANNNTDDSSFMGRLRNLSALTFDLPTEAQWEYACRAGTRTALYNGQNLTSTQFDANATEVGRYKGNKGYSVKSDNTTKGTAKVGSYSPNAWELYDMLGNVWEWCLDWGGNYTGAQNDPKGASSGSRRVYRGGCYNSYACDCRAAHRFSHISAYINMGVGFRVALRDPNVPAAKDTPSANKETASSTESMQSPFSCTTNNGVITITKYTGPGWDVTIPSTINGLPVIGIGDRAFFRCAVLARVTVPAGVVRIGAYAFCDCANLTSVTIPDTVTDIGGYTGTNTTMIIPGFISEKPVKVAGAMSCSTIERIEVADANTSYRDIEGVLYSRDGSQLIQYPEANSRTNFVIPGTVTKICDEAFVNNRNLASVTIPSNVVHIGKSAFFNSSLLGQRPRRPADGRLGS